MWMMVEVGAGGEDDGSMRSRDLSENETVMFPTGGAAVDFLGDVERSVSDVGTGRLVPGAVRRGDLRLLTMMLTGGEDKLFN